MLRLLGYTGVLLGVSGCVVIHLPPDNDTHDTDIKVQLVQPFDWDLTVAPKTEVSTHTSTSQGCDLPPSPVRGIPPLLDIKRREHVLSPLELDNLMLDYIDDLHLYIEQYQKNNADYQILIRSLCEGEDTH